MCSYQGGICPKRPILEQGKINEEMEKKMGRLAHRNKVKQKKSKKEKPGQTSVV